MKSLFIHLFFQLILVPTALAGAALSPQEKFANHFFERLDKNLSRQNQQMLQHFSPVLLRLPSPSCWQWPSEELRNLSPSEVEHFFDGWNEQQAEIACWQDLQWYQPVKSFPLSGDSLKEQSEGFADRRAGDRFPIDGVSSSATPSQVDPLNQVRPARPNAKNALTAMVESAALSGESSRSEANQGPPLLQPLTVFILPGLMSEFVPPIFSEIFSDGACQRLNNVTDKRYSLKEMKEISVPLSDTVACGVLQTDLVRANIYLLKAVAGTNESMGDTARTATYYQARIKKILDSENDPNTPVTLIGYSRGANVALELLQSRPRPDWIKRVQAVVSLGGAVNGSSLVQRLLDPEYENEVTTQLYFWLKETADQLTGDSYLRDISVWTQAIADLAKIYLKNGAGLSGELEEVGGLGQLFANAISYLLNELNLRNFFRDHKDNVLRFKKLVDDLGTAIEQISPGQRAQWWSGSVLPPHINYLSLGGVFLPKTPSAPPYLGSPWDSESSMDYETLLQSYRLFKDYSHNSLNDGQVALYQAQIWPAGGLEKERFQFLGALNAHHWSMAMRGVAGSNDYPRRSLIEAILDYTVTIDEPHQEAL